MDNKDVQLRKKWIAKMEEDNLEKRERIESLNRDIRANNWWITTREQEIHDIRCTST